jgi:uncharacterized NAD(P)/FAD-binding protein YdhS
VKHIVIIGGGFSGGMTAVNLVRKSAVPLIIDLIDPGKEPLRGTAYSSYTDKHLLNVPTNKMSAFHDDPGHFLQWVLKQKRFSRVNESIVGTAFLPRNIYGNYLSDLWKQTVRSAAEKGIILTHHQTNVRRLAKLNGNLKVVLENDSEIFPDSVVLATGNLAPADPSGIPEEVIRSSYYHKNPWNKAAISNSDGLNEILIVGNGLTMVDTVIGLKESGFKGVIHALSPHGFNILPHRHNGMTYDAIKKELDGEHSLHELITMVNRHVSVIREFGISAEPVVDAIRPHMQRIWKSFSEDEKRLFMRRVRHLWGVARHRIPLHIHDKIQQLRLDRKLIVLSGKIQTVKKEQDHLQVTYLDKKLQEYTVLHVSRIINCTGPQTDLQFVPEHFLHSCLQDGMITQDKLKLGIQANTETFEVKDSTGQCQNNLFALGSLLKGELWESTAVNELRLQAVQLAEHLLKN